MSKNAPRVQFNFMEDEAQLPDTDIKMEIDDDDYTIDTLDIPQVVEREEVKEENIFDAPRLDITESGLHQRASVSLVPHEEEEPETSGKKQVKNGKDIKCQIKTTKTGKTRKPMSEEHKEKLKYAREKALESRKQKQKERAEQREFEAEEKELLKKKKQKDFEKLKKEVNEEVTPKPAQDTQIRKPQPQIIQQTFSKKDLEEAQLDAIIKYEAIRKERKAKKKEQELIQKQRDEMKAKINNYGSRTNGKLNNRYDICY